jgi:hypothetical protein
LPVRKDRSDPGLGSPWASRAGSARGLADAEGLVGHLVGQQLSVLCASIKFAALEIKGELMMALSTKKLKVYL